MVREVSKATIATLDDAGPKAPHSLMAIFEFGASLNWIAADIVRIKDGVLVEHWDVIQDEATREQSKSGQPMFGDSFGR
jgi:hypothetical protein